MFVFYAYFVLEVTHVFTLQLRLQRLIRQLQLMYFFFFFFFIPLEDDNRFSWISKDSCIFRHICRIYWIKGNTPEKGTDNFSTYIGNGLSYRIS